MTASKKFPISVFTNSLIALIAAASLSLLHKFFANDSMAFHIELLRLQKRNAPEHLGRDGMVISSDAIRAVGQAKGRNWRLSASEWILWIAAVSLILGICLAAYGMRFVQVI